MRAFIAIELSQEIKDSLSQLQERLKSSQADVKWVSPQNIHLTLKFLGEVDESKLEKIGEILETLKADKTPFYMRLSSVGAFPKTNYPRVIWAGIDKGDTETKEIAKFLEEKIAKLGIPAEDRPFSSHITIGRVKSGLNREGLVKKLNESVNHFAKANLEFQVEKITLFKSTLTPKGPVYEILKEVSLTTT
ncbi:MAG: RNA 2',3'-cyclic phosphodiesterase [Candidatus Omnitrophica bacterium]|nr:RNA 2',3'-cyclic phosphodiesterase [Candidatus Omnitrophota bacterium]